MPFWIPNLGTNALLKYQALSLMPFKFQTIVILYSTIVLYTGNIKIIKKKYSTISIYTFLVC